MQPSKQSCEKKLELLYFTLKLHSALVDHLVSRNRVVDEESYAASKTEYFQLKLLIIASSTDWLCFDRSIEAELKKLHEIQLGLLRVHHADFNSKLIIEIQKGFLEFRIIIQKENANTLPIKARLTILINEIKLSATARCDLKHRLLFFELKTIENNIVLLEWLSKLLEPKIIDTCLNVQLLKIQIKKGKEYYQQVNTLFSNSIDYERLLKLDNELEMQLENFYNIRKQFQQDFSQFFTVLKEKFTNSLSLLVLIENVLFIINDNLENITCKINRLSDISEQQLKNFEIILATAKHMVMELCITDVLQEQYNTAYRLTMLNLLLQTWLQELQQHELAIKTKYPNAATIPKILAAKQLTSDYKAHYYQSIYQSIKHLDVLTSLNQRLALHNAQSVNVVVKSLKEENIKLRQVISKIENAIEQCALLTKVPVFLLQIATHNWYFRIAETYVRGMQELTSQDSFKNIPIVGTHLNETQLKVLSALQTTLFIGIELGVARAWGVSYSLLSSLIELAMPNITLLSNVGRYLALDEINAINFLPCIKWLLGLQIQCLLYMYLTNDTDFLFPASSYIVTTALNKFMLSAFDIFLPRFSSNNFIRFIASNSTFFIAGWLWKDIYPVVKAFFAQPTDQELLSDSLLCEQYKVRCKNIAFTTLELHETASVPEVKEQFKKLALSYHPDKSTKGYTGSFFENIHLAKRRAIECIHAEPLNFSIPTFANKH